MTKLHGVCFSLVVGLLLLAGVPLFLSPLNLPARADPGILYVRAGGGGDCSTPALACSSLQQAVDLATAAQEIRVATGVYTENLTITQGLSLRGGWDAGFTMAAPDPALTVLEGLGDHNVGIGNSGTPLPLATAVVLEGLTFRNGRDGVHSWGGAITISNCLILNADKQGVEIDGDSRVRIVGSQVLTAQQGIEVDRGVVEIVEVRVAHTSEEGILIEVDDALPIVPPVVTVTYSLVEDCSQQGIQSTKQEAGQGAALWLLDTQIRDVISDAVRIQYGQAVVADNVISNVIGVDAHGIYIRDAEMTLRDNQIIGIGDRGIHARGDRVTLLRNTIERTGGDGIRTDAASGDVEIRGNRITGAGNDGIDGRGARLQISGNWVSGAPDNGIKAEEVGVWAAVEANHVLNNVAGIVLQGVPVFTLTNNIVGDNLAYSVGMTGSMRGVLYHNTLVGSGLGRQGTGVAILSPLAVTLANNIVVSHTQGVIAVPGAAVTMHHTLLWGNQSDPVSGVEVVAESPSFVDAGARDYHLLPTSAAVNRGVELGIHTDIDGNWRPFQGAPELGADELTGSERIYLPYVLKGSAAPALTSRDSSPDFPRDAGSLLPAARAGALPGDAAIYLPLVLREGSTAPPLYQIFADPADLDWLAGKPYRDETIPATFVYERSWETEMRYRGDTSRLMPKKCWKLFFPASDLFEGQEELNLNADYIDASLLRSAVGYDFLSRAGIPTPRAGYARVNINDSYYGLFSQVEQIDERFLYRMGIDIHGNLYKPNYGGLHTVTYEDPEEELWWYGYYYPKKTNRDSNMDDMIALIAVINDTPEEAFPTAIAGVLDVNEWLDWYAANILLGNFEMLEKNYYLYHDLSRDRWIILPWDVDLALGHNYECHAGGLFDEVISWTNFIDSGTSTHQKCDGKWNALIDRMMQVPEFRYFHGRRLVEMMAGPFSPDEMFPRIDRFFAAIRPYAEADTMRWQPAGFAFSDGPEELKRYVTNRRTWLYMNLPAFMPELKPPLVLNEMMANNAGGITDEAGDADPWLEIFNASETLTWDLGGMYLSDDPDHQPKWRIPDGTTLAPQGTLKIWADGEPGEGPLHTNFALDPAGGTLDLWDRTIFGNAPIFRESYGAQAAGVAYGRLPDGDGAWQALSLPTPGWRNEGHPPVITGTAPAPAYPAAGVPVQVSTTVLDEGAVTVTLHYRAYGALDEPPVYTAVPMSPVGSDGYVGAIPGQADRLWIDYYIEAVDGAGMVTVDRPGWPEGDYRLVVGWQPPTVVINELMAVNAGTLEDPEGKTPDWIELYNPGPADVDVGGMFLTDDPLLVTRAQIPAGTVIPAGGYLILWADGQGVGDHLGFGISGAGEALVLYDRADRGYAPVDAVYFDPQEPDVSWGRYPDGGESWYGMPSPTPGEANRLLPPTFLSVTRTPRWPGDGAAATVTATISSGLPLASTTLWVDVSVSPQGGFSPAGMSPYSGQLPAQPEGTWVSYYLEAVDTAGQTTFYPPGAPAFMERYRVGYTPPALVINEFLASNTRGSSDEAGEFEDWVELYNESESPVALDGLYLTDDLTDPTQWPFPAGTVLSPGAHLLVWCDNDPEQGPYHATFKLDRDGESIGLFDADAIPLDWLAFGAQQTDVSYGRQPDGGRDWRFFNLPTPGAANE